MHKYNPLFFAGLVSLCILGFVLAGIASALPHYTTLDHVLNTIGGAILVADMILVLIADWRGFVTLNGRIKWRSMSDGKRIWFGCLFCIFSPLLLILYLVQIARYKPPPPPVVPQEVQQYLLDGDLGKLKQSITESIKQHQ